MDPFYPFTLPGCQCSRAVFRLPPLPGQTLLDPNQPIP
jgi:hypothetical protein